MSQLIIIVHHSKTLQLHSYTHWYPYLQLFPHMRQDLHSGGGLLPQLQQLLIAFLNLLVQALQL